MESRAFAVCVPFPAPAYWPVPCVKVPGRKEQRNVKVLPLQAKGWGNPEALLWGF